MARARNIKPSFFKNELLGLEDPMLSLLFISLWTLADREGRLEDRPLRIKAETFPYREVSDINGYLTVLAQHGFIERYKVAEQSIIQIVNFRKHQSPHNTEKESELPEKQINTPITVKEPLQDCELTKAKRSDSLIPDSLIPDSLIPDSLIPGMRCPHEKLIELYHEHMPENPRVVKLTKTRKESIKARWDEAAKLTAIPFGYDSEDAGLEAWRQFFEICAESAFLTGKSKPKEGKPVWIADVDFLFSPNGFIKCLENKYHREVVNG